MAGRKMQTAITAENAIFIIAAAIVAVLILMFVYVIKIINVIMSVIDKWEKNPTFVQEETE